MNSPLTFDEIAKMEEAKNDLQKKIRILEEKRLVKYPLMVRKVKRLRRQISALNRCIRRERKHHEWVVDMYGEIISQKPSDFPLWWVGMVCFMIGFLLG